MKRRRETYRITVGKNDGTSVEEESYYLQFNEDNNTKNCRYTVATFKNYKEEDLEEMYQDIIHDLLSDVLLWCLIASHWVIQGVDIEKRETDFIAVIVWKKEINS